MSDKKGKFVNTFLEGDLLKDFELVKVKLGIRTNSDVMRFLVRREAQRLRRVDLAESPVGAAELAESRA
jgi:hypothetical protein